jgi:putative inorganic carbon (hco3(-)) transporter
MWVWISVMNPHRLTWGFAYSLPFAAIVASATLFSVFFTKEPRHFPVKGVTIALLLFILWMNVTTLFAFHPEEAYFQWSRVMKTMLMVFVMLLVLHSRKHIHILVWVLVLSLGFYGIKGGIFTILSGGVYRVWGPDGSYIADNNSISLALIMIIPLMRYLQTISRKAIVRHSLTAAMGLSAMAALGSHSRGAFLAITAMAGFLWLKSRNKITLGLVAITLIPLALMFMPDKWVVRMETIKTYQEDKSVQGRFNAWWMAWNVAKNRPLVGGGYELYGLDVFARYAPDPTGVHSAHSIIFQALGEHGFVGLGLYSLLGLLTWRTGSWITRRTVGRDDLDWASELGRMVQVSLMGFATGGLFLNLVYLDITYYFMVILVLTRVLLEKEARQEQAPPRVRASQNFGARPFPSSG